MQEVNKLGTTPIKKLSMIMSLPMVASMIALALYNLVDSIFIARISENALSAVSYSSPVQLIMIAVALGTGVGINSILSRKLGEKDYKTSKKIIFNGLILIFISYLLFLIFGLFFTETFFSFFTKNKEIISLGKTYLSTCTIFSLGMFFQIAFEKIMEAIGKPVKSMLIQFSGALINLILDPILIFGFWKIPGLGILGAAMATVIGQTLGMLIGVLLNIKHIKSLKNKENFKLDRKIIKEIYSVGFPTIILESVSAFVTIILNKFLVIISENLVSVWLIYIKIQSFIFMIVYGFNNGMIPIIGYNYGAKNENRVNETVRFFLKLSVSVMFLGMLLFLIFPEWLFNIYKASPEVITYGIPAVRILSLGFIFAGISIILSGYFQATGYGSYSLVVFLTRQLIVAVPLVFLINYLFNYKYIWFAFVISEFTAMVYAIIKYRKIKVKSC